MSPAIQQPRLRIGIDTRAISKRCRKPVVTSPLIGAYRSSLVATVVPWARPATSFGEAPTLSRMASTQSVPEGCGPSWSSGRFADLVYNRLTETEKALIAIRSTPGAITPAGGHRALGAVRAG